MPTEDLTRLFSPRAVAVAGASSNPDSAGQDYVRALQKAGFLGPIYPINPRATEIAGLPAFPSVADIPGEVDLVISCVPAGGVLELIDQCGEKRIPFLHLFTGRFSETGDEDAVALEREIERRAAERGIRILGPNGMGLYHPAGGISFRPDLPVDHGSVAFLSQSGNNAMEVITRGHFRGLRFGKVANYGNGMDLTPAVLLRYLGEDPTTSVIGAYIEGVPAGRPFFDALRDASTRKPVIIHKAGRTASGARAATSHTAALAGSADIWSSAIRQAGALEAHDQEQLLDLMVTASLLGRPAGNRAAVVGGGGGRSVQSADACEENGLVLPDLPISVRESIREKAPMLADWVRNPVDQSILAGSGLSSNGLLELMLASDAYDFGIANIGEDWFFGRPDAAERLRHACNRTAAIAKASPRPVAVVLGSTETLDPGHRAAVDEVRDAFHAAGIATFPSIERAARSIAMVALS
jgi:acyl-CoA synthetase (NDP forming)